MRFALLAFASTLACFACTPRCGDLPESLCTGLDVDQVAFVGRTVPRAGGGFEQEIVEWIWGVRPAGLTRVRVKDYRHTLCLAHSDAAATDFRFSQPRLFVVSPGKGGYRVEHCLGFAVELTHPWVAEFRTWVNQGRSARVALLDPHRIPPLEFFLPPGSRRARVRAELELRRGETVHRLRFDPSSKGEIQDVSPGAWVATLRVAGKPEIRRNVHIPPGACSVAPIDVREAFAADTR